MCRSLLLAFPLLFSSFVTTGAEIPVSAGDGTLAQAIADASEGDVLLLTDGAFLGNTVVDKGLTIQGTGSSTIMGTMRIQASGSRVTLQGLEFSFNLYVDDGAEVRIIENRFIASADIDLNNYSSSDGDGALYIIGNQFGSTSEVRNNRSEGAYIAGNTFEQGRIHSYAGVWVVGNEIKAVSDDRAINIGSGNSNVIGNRVSGAEDHYAIQVSGGSILVAANIVKLKGNSWAYHGIYVNASGTGRILNNLVISTEGNQVYRAYYISGGDLLVANNIAGNVNSYWFEGNLDGVVNNLCYGSGSNCGRDAIVADPAFVDTVDFQLSEGSPAIDTGLDVPYFADLDRTRADIGPHGGPWAIDQFDRQRHPDYTGPFVYPLFDANATIEPGQIRVRALGVARLR